MKTYLTETKVICDLHEKGYTDDFHSSGNDLLWVQGKLFIRAGDFSIPERYRLYKHSQKDTYLVISGVISQYHNVKGILINHYSKITLKAPLLSITNK